GFATRCASDRRRGRSRGARGSAPRAERSLPRSYNELRHLRPGEQPERDEGRAETGRDVERCAADLVEPLDESRSKVGEPELAAGVGKDDLAGVEVSREHELEQLGRGTPDDAGEVAEEDVQVD